MLHTECVRYFGANPIVPLHQFHDVPLLLVTGTGRSGTTVLTKSLAAHPQIYSNRVESNVMKDVLLAGHASSTMPSRTRQMVLERDQHDQVFQNMLLHLLFPADRWTAQEMPKSISTFSAMTPDAADFAVAVFPGIHFANIVRNGIEVVASRIAHRGMGQQSFEKNCTVWAAAQEMTEWGKDRPDFTLVRHEQLLATEACQQLFKDLFDRAGLPFTDEAAKYVATNRFNQTSYEGESAELEKRVERWQKWDDEQRATFRRICGKAMDYFGYEIPT